MNSNTLSPVSRVSRIISIDILRGAAVLGILIMNIQSFSMPTAAYINPTAYGDLTGINKWVWIASHILASEKFMSIFSMLFGAGVLIFSENVWAKGKNSAALHYKRMGWLLLFGFIHGYMLWYGDILVTYSLCGMVVFLFRNLRSRSLIWISFGFFLVPMILDALFTLSMPYWPEEAVDNTAKFWHPDQSSLQHNLEALRGGWLSQMEIRFPGAVMMQTGLFVQQTFWRVMAMMLLGMALFKWSILSAERSRKFYLMLVMISLAVGYALCTVGVCLNFRNGWSMEYSMFLGKEFNYMGSAGIALGYVGIIMLICLSPGYRRFKHLFAAVGRMAFSNYILQTLICIFIFYGHGLGLYGSVERKHQVLIVFGIWILIMVISPLWLKRYRFGPLEWLWRSLTYWRWKL